jgi:hypothetical protein
MSSGFGPTARRLARLTLTVLLATAWCGAVPQLMQVAVAQPAQGRGPAAPSDARAAAALLKRLYATAEQELRKPGANPSDVHAKAAELGFDAGKIFAFVRDEVAYEPYRGVLRGARGALASRAGNALDKALLLKVMLQAGGHDARLVRGQLPPERARALVDQYLKRPPAPQAGADAFQLPPALAEQIGVPPADLEAVLADNRRAADQFLAEATAAADVEATFVRQQLDGSGVKLGRTFDQWVQELTSRASDHAWVQWVGPDGAPQVLDPSFTADAAPSAPPEGKPADNFDADRHAVRFQFIYVAKANGQPSEQVLLDVPIAADEALYDPPAFSIEPADPLPPPSKLAEMDPDAAIKLLTGFKNYQAVLRVGGRRSASNAFDLKGNVTPVSADGRIKGAQQLGGATGGLFGGGLGGGLGGGGAQAEAANNFVEIAVVLTFQSPGAAPDARPASQRRVLLTQAQTTGDEFLSPILEWKMLLQPQAPSAQLAGYEALQSTVRALGAMLPLLDAPNSADVVLNRAASVPPSAYPAELFDLAGFGQSALAARLGQAQGLKALWDRPQMSIQERRFCANAKERRTCGHAAIDIVDNGLSIVPTSPQAAGAAADVALAHGVFETVAESMLLKRNNDAASAAAGTDQGPAKAAAAVLPAGAIEALRGARESGAGLVLASPADAAALAGTALSESDRKWIAAHEAPGNRVLAAKSGASAWWSIDPVTGRALGRRDGGRGQAFHEYAVQAAAGGICGAIAFVNLRRDVAASGGKATDAQRKGFAITLVGCFIGSVVGGAGVGVAPKMASALTLLNAFIGAAFSFWGAEVARGG